MPVLVSKTFGEGAYTPHCMDCMVPMCWDISEEEYNNNSFAWDNWTCEYCRESQAQQLREEEETVA